MGPVLSKASLADLGARAMKVLDSAHAQEIRAVDSALRHIGLQRRASAMRPVWFFAAGAVAAASLVLILAPDTRKALRAKIRELLQPLEGNGSEPPPVESAPKPKPANGVILHPATS